MMQPHNNQLVVIQAQNPDAWNDFIASHTSETFHHNWEWGTVYEKAGHQVFRFTILDAKKTQVFAQCLAICIRARRGAFVLVPHGPVFDSSIKNPKALGDILKAITCELKNIAEVQKCDFVRVAPILFETPENTALFTKLGYRKAPIFVQSEQSWVLDIQPPEEDMLRAMRKSTRYILRREDTFPIAVTQSHNPDDWQKFYDLYTKTVQAQGFFGQSEEFMKNEFDIFAEKEQASLFFAHQTGTNELLAAAMVIQTNNAGYYHYGASLKNLGSALPAAHILQWNIIKTMKNDGVKMYNFWGVAPADKLNHPWNGLSLFKKGFGGSEHTYVRTQDYVLSLKYWFTFLIETFRKIKRGY